MKKFTQSGFTIIELILVLAIVLIITLFSAAFYSRFLLQNGVDNTVDQLTGSMRKAQIYSMMGKQFDSWSVNFSSNTVTVYKGTSFAGRNSVFDEKFILNPNITVSGITDVNFSRITGLPTPSTLTISVSGGGNSKNISVNNQGVVTK